MTPEEKLELKQLISKEIVKTEKEIVRLKDLSKPVEPDRAIGRITRMDAIQSKSINEAALFQTENKLVDLKQAITNADNDSFGTCIICKNSIQIERLMFMPESTKCVKCAGKY